MRYALLLTLITIMAAVYAIPANAQASGLVSCWSMDETGGVRADSYGSNHLSDINTVGFADGKMGMSSLFSGDNNEELETLNSNSLQLLSYTYTFWIWYEPPADIVYSFPVYKRDSFRMQRTYSTADVMYILANDSNGGSDYIHIYTDPVDSQWVFVAASFDANSGVARINIDGQTVVTGTISDTSTTDTHLVIGRGLFGRMDEVSLWSEQLTEAQVNALYNDGAGIPCSVIAGDSGDGNEIPYAIELVDLPSGKSGAIQYSITSGDVAIVTVLSILLTLIIYWIIRDNIVKVGVHNDTNK